MDYISIDLFQVFSSFVTMCSTLPRIVDAVCRNFVYCRPFFQYTVTKAIRLQPSESC